MTTWLYPATVMVLLVCPVFMVLGALAIFDDRWQRRHLREMKERQSRWSEFYDEQGNPIKP